MKKILSFGLGAGVLLSQVALVMAQGTDIKIEPNTKWVTFTNIGPLITGFVSLAILIAALLSFLYLVWGGIEWISSGGDKAGMEAARNRITAAFVGLTIVLAAWAIMKLIEAFFGIHVLDSTLTIPSVQNPLR